MAFIIAGVNEEWPEAMQLRLRQQYGIKKEKQIHPTFTGKFSERRESGFWYSFLEHLVVDKHELSALALHKYEQTLIELLSESEYPNLFCWELRPGLKEHLDGTLLKDLTNNEKSPGSAGETAKV